MKRNDGLFWHHLGWAYAMRTVHRRQPVIVTVDRFLGTVYLFSIVKSQGWGAFPKFLCQEQCKLCCNRAWHYLSSSIDISKLWSCLAHWISSCDFLCNVLSILTWFNFNFCKFESCLKILVGLMQRFSSGGDSLLGKEKMRQSMS